MLLTALLLPLIAGAALPNDPALEHATRAGFDYKLLWQGRNVPFYFLGVDVNVYAPRPLENGARPHFGNAPKFFTAGWQVEPGPPAPIKIKGLLGSVKCLDAGSSPRNGNKVHMWECYDGLTQQQWVIADNKIKLRDFDLCLDITDGNNTKPIQVWRCYDGNENQHWEALFVPY